MTRVAVQQTAWYPLRMRVAFTVSILSAGLLLSACGGGEPAEAVESVPSSSARLTTRPAATFTPPAVSLAPVTSSGTVSNAPAGLVSEATWPGDWPFTVSEGVLMCASGRVTFASDRVQYGLNGDAMSAGGFEDVSLIWQDSDFPGVKVSLRPMIEKGLTLC